MKNKIILFFCCLPLIAFPQQNEKIQFVKGKTWQQIIQLAESQHKNIFIDANATWCGPCKKMDAEVFTDDSVARYINRNYVSIKVQIDRTDNDVNEIRTWYRDADQIRKKYQIEALPTFLFLSSTGEIQDRAEGFQSIKDFLSLATRANDPKRNFSYRIQQFKTNSISGNSLLNLSMMAKAYHEDSLALQIAMRFKNSWIEKHECSTTFNPEIKSFISTFPSIFNISDKSIDYMFRFQKEADSLLDGINFSTSIVEYVIAKDVIGGEMKHNGVYATIEPKWDKLHRYIKSHYNSQLADKLVLNGKISWYGHKNDMENVARLCIQRMDKYGIDTVGIGRSAVNNLIFEVVFMHSTDPKVLTKALGYMKLLLDAKPEADSWIDTYANLLYKLGNKLDALKHEEQAITIALKRNDNNRIADYRKVISKMQKDEPTWAVKY